MKEYGLIGYPLGHSFSQKYFTDKFLKEGIHDCVYRIFPIESIDILPELINSHPDLQGFNVTIPYKEQVIKFLDSIDSEAKEIGAVNTVLIKREEGKIFLKGFNTDVYGFRLPLERCIKPEHSHALILGTGGASKAVAWVLKQMSIEFSFVSRNPQSASDFRYGSIPADVVKSHKLIVNTSPVGMHPHEKEAPNLPYCSITPDHILYDLIYNPEKTRFLKKGKEKKATLINGLPMLYLQAEKAWEIWNQKPI